MTAARVQAQRGIDVAAALAARWGRTVTVVCLLLIAALAIVDVVKRSPTGIQRQVFDEPGLAGRTVGVDRVPAIRLDGPGVGTLPERMFSVRWTGFWVARHSGEYQFLLGADDGATLRIDGRIVHQRDSDVGFGTTPVRVSLDAGVHELDVAYDQRGGGSFLNLLVARGAEDAAPLSPRDLFPTRQDAWRLGTNERLDKAWGYGLPRVAVLLIALLLVRTIGVWRDGARHAGDDRRIRAGWNATRDWLGSQRPAVVILLAIALTGVAAALRFDAMAAKYGALDGPPWAAAVQRTATATVDLVRPAGWTWPAIAAPYIGGDPINYLKFAREMTGFYQAHVREPMFLATTRVFLATLGNQDVAVSFASTLYSTLLVTATFALGVETFGLGPGLIAGGAMAIERVAIDWGVDGWRDDASAFFVVVVAVVLVRLMRRPSGAWAVVFGVVGAAAALTRITSLLLWAPAVVAFVLLRASPTPLSRRVILAMASLGICGALVAPYLINCARSFGDPLYAINYHTTFYRAREHADASTSMSAAGYVLAKLRSQPARLFDTGFYGVAAFPFTNKWEGFAPWSPLLPGTLRIAALIGLLLFGFSWQGRVLLAVLVLSVLPFAVTWNIPGGGEWRFTLPAYPFFLVAAGVGVRRLAWLVGGLVRAPGAVLDTCGRIDRRLVAGIAAVVALVVAGLTLLPWLALREAVATSTTVTVVPDTRDAVIFAAGWADRPAGRCLAAVSDRPTIRLPLPRDASVRVVLHLTDVQPAGAAATLVDVTASQGLRSRVTLRPDDRNQQATLVVPASAMGPLTTTVDLRSAATTSSRSGNDGGGARFAICAVELTRESTPGTSH